MELGRRTGNLESAICCRNRDSSIGVTFALFLRHSVHAFGVTIPRPRRLFELLELESAIASRQGGIFQGRLIADHHL